MVLADAVLTPLADNAFLADHTHSFADAWLGTLAFSGQIVAEVLTGGLRRLYARACVTLAPRSVPGNAPEVLMHIHDDRDLPTLPMLPMVRAIRERHLDGILFDIFQDHVTARIIRSTALSISRSEVAIIFPQLESAGRLSGNVTNLLHR